MHSLFISEKNLVSCSTTKEKIYLGVNLYLIPISFLIGIGVSSVFLLLNNETSSFFAIFLKNYIDIKQTFNYIQWCALCIFSIVISIGILFFLSYSSIGFIFCYLIPFLKGVFCGGITSYLFTQYAGKGLLICLFQYFPWQLTSALIIFIYTYICSNLSLQIFEIICLQKATVKKYSPKSSIFWGLLLILATVLLCIVTNLGNIFTFS